MTSLISISNLKVIKDQKTILSNITLDIQEHDKMVISGPSGSGKSTLLKSILYFEVFSSGAMHWRDEIITCKNLFAYRKQFAFISQTVPVFEGSLLEYILFPFSFKQNCHKKPSEDQIQHYLDVYVLNPTLLRQPFMTLSTGERQRASLIQALLLDKPVLLLDEISSNLDPQNVDVVIHSILNDTQRTIIAVTHDIRWQREYVQLFYLDEGKLSRK